MFRLRLFRALLLTALCALPLTLCAQETDEPNPIKWTIKANPLRARIDTGWHLYSTEKVEGGPSPTRIILLPQQNLEVAGEIDSPAPRSAYDPNFQVATEYYEGEVTFTIPVKSSEPAPPR